MGYESTPNRRIQFQQRRSRNSVLQYEKNVLYGIQNYKGLLK